MNVKNVVINGKETSYYLFDNGDLYNYKIIKFPREPLTMVMLDIK